MTDPKPAGEQLWATAYHQTVTDLRRELAESSAMFEVMCAPHREAVFAALCARREDPQAPRPSAAETAADLAGMMAASYAYTLAAVLAVAEKEFGGEAARQLACVADEIITNGDFDGFNEDVLPDPAEVTAKTAARMAAHECSFPVQPPEGSIVHPGPCRICGKTWERSQAERSLAEAQAAMAATEAVSA